MNILAIIPARCGSKGILDKNIIDICGKPLIAYSIEQGLMILEDNLISRLIVSTDCEMIAEIACKFGAEVPFLRPKSISDDKAKSIEFVIHALDFYEERGERFDAVLLMQPTSPMRSPDLLKQAVELFVSNADAKSLISVYEEEYINDLVMYRKEGDLAVPLNPGHNKGIRRQDHGSIYVRNGSIYITSVLYLRAKGSLIADKPLLVNMNKSDSINVDTIEDVELLRRHWCL